MKEEYLQKATDPHQYDTEAVDWKKEGLKDSPTRQFFQEYLEQDLDIKDKSILDIGSGMGQLFPMLKRLGAKTITGIEPSANNIAVSYELYPETQIFNGSLEQADLKETFDAAISVMVFEHIIDIEKAFLKIRSLLNPKGILYLIVADIQYHKSPRFNYVVEKMEVDSDTIVVKTTRPLGTLYDILRPLQSYIQTAEKSGFRLEKHIELKPTKKFISLEPKYAQFATIPICHLLVLRR